MNREQFLHLLLGLFLFSATSATATSQSTELPSAPALGGETKPSPASVSQTPGIPRVIVQSKGAPPSTPEEDDFCYAPAEGLYAPQPREHPASKDSEEMWYVRERYDFAIHDRIEASWHRHIPWRANGYWIKGRVVVIRFAVMPDGSIDTPVITLSSGRKDYDKGVMDAVTKALPFPPLPDGVVGPHPMCLRFGYFTDPQPKHDPPPDPLTPALNTKP